MRRPLCHLLILCVLVCCSSAWAQDGNGIRPVQTVTATRTTSKISIDGRLNEDAWDTAPAVGGFNQRDPDEGQPATQNTIVRFLYDDHALYVGAALDDTDPAGIVARTSRRDDYHDGDYFQLYLDPYHDHRTGVLFQVNAAGSLRDFIISNDTNTDVSWDAVWDAAVSRSETGWFVEMSIPFSQLRFAKAGKQTWGVNAARFLFRRNETSWLELVPKSEYGLVSRFANLTGIEGIEPGHNLEVLPYVRGGARFSPSTPGDPFNDGSSLSGGAGVDLKYGLSSNLTLDATMNPDFGQVEVDPAVVNLSAFETFFQERRPFFVEGSQIFSNFGRLGGVCCGVVFPTYFYSRRIGRSPQGPASGDSVSRPNAATILGAAKLTGKPARGWTLGLLNATTGSEYAKVINAGAQSKVKIEPVADYTVGRVLRDFGNRGGIGVLATSIQRKLDIPSLQNIMPSASRMVGADGYYYFGKQRSWSINGRMSGAWNYGSSREIDRLQRAPQRYLQRPDATNFHYDPNATVMKGWAGGTNFGKISGGWTMAASIAANSPGFDVNDAGFQGTSDLWGTTFSANWRQLKPDRFTRSRNINVFRYDSWNFNRDPKGRFIDISGGITFLNYWGIFGDMSFNQKGVDDRLTRGGPLTLSTADKNFFIGLNSDGRKRVNFNLNTNYGYNERGNWYTNENFNLGLKPSTSINVSPGLSFNRSYQFVQYVQTVDDVTALNTYGKRYVFADLDQSSVSMTTRVNWSLTPKMSVQVFQQLLLSVGDYWGFKELERPRTLSFLKYGQDTGTISKIDTDYTVDPDGIGPANPFTFSDPNFNFKSLLTNAVFRWEFKPGTTLFLVWQQGRTDSQYPGDLSPGRDLRAIFGAPSTNVFLVKTAYWFNR
jgi:Domain of unknown function (DUF5916)/Carbohydrate family 9 binding domain-like